MLQIYNIILQLMIKLAPPNSPVNKKNNNKMYYVMFSSCRNTLCIPAAKMDRKSEDNG